MGRPHKFQMGDRVIGKDEGPASFRERTGSVEVIGPSSGEYGICFDDRPEVVEYVMSSWVERIAA